MDTIQDLQAEVGGEVLGWLRDEPGGETAARCEVDVQGGGFGKL